MKIPIIKCYKESVGEEIMKKKRLYFAIIWAVFTVLLTACGPSADKLSEAEEARTLLINARQAAEETFLDITDSTNKERLKELSEKFNKNGKWRNRNN